MANIKYHVALSDEERELLQGIIRKGKSPSPVSFLRSMRKRPPLNATEAAQQYSVHAQTVHTVGRTDATHRLEAVLERRKIQAKPAKMTGDVEERIIAL